MKETGKQRAQRMPLDYYRGSNFVERWKGRLGWLALVVAVVWLGSSMATAPGEMAFHGSRGPVAAVHQAWNDQCSACHSCCEPISSHSWPVPGLMSKPADGSAKCQACHQGPEHHVGQKPSLSCGACHRDHQGINASLTRLPDSDCTQCHSDLPGAAKDGVAKFQSSVTSLAAHPEFRSLAQDPGKLKFNHKLHMTPGMAFGGGGPLVRLGDLPPQSRERFTAMQTDKGASAPVQLQCASCHVLDSAESPVRGQGAYFLPVRYENQCKACHPLEVPIATAEGKPARVDVPHGIAPKNLEGWLRTVNIAHVVEGKAGLLNAKLSATRPLPGKLPGIVQSDPALATIVEKNQMFAHRFLFQDKSKNACVECHHFETEKADAKDAWSLRMAPTNVPQVWLQHAKFDHKAHRAVQCNECHAGSATSTQSGDVLIPGLNNCVKCHAPKGEKDGRPVGGARFDCTECHLYHGRTDAGQLARGLGASSRGVPEEQRKGIADFLRFTAPKGK